MNPNEHIHRSACANKKWDFFYFYRDEIRQRVIQCAFFRASKIKLFRFRNKIDEKNERETGNREKGYLCLCVTCVLRASP